MAVPASSTAAVPAPVVTLPAAASPTHHYAQLDALRGLAAGVVVLDHFLRLWDPTTLPSRVRLLLAVLAPFFNGGVSVLIFFLLSGFVLSLPYERGNPLPYPTFALRRLARIYLPYLGALLLALLADWQLHGTLAVSPWFNQTWTAPLTPRLISQSVLMLGNYDTAQVNTAFWSLPVEMRLSLIFPLLCLPLLRWRPAFAFGLLAATAVAYAAVIRLLPHRLSAVSFTNLAEQAAGIFAFAVGILLVRGMPAIRTWWGTRKAASRLLLGLAVLVALEYPGLLTRGHLFLLSVLLTHAGAAGLLALALCSRRLARVLTHPVPAWLGRVSYSLYLVHATVLFALVHLFFPRVSRLGLLMPYLVISLTLAFLFFFMVEKPSMRLSRSIGRRRRTLVGTKQSTREA
jgi:peptidoglycan/LPS O-acetylase OafA/YrhL